MPIEKSKKVEKKCLLMGFFEINITKYKRINQGK